MAVGKVIVTVQARHMSVDLEIPTDVIMADLKPELLSAMRNIAADEFYHVGQIVVMRRGYLMGDERKTLADYGVCDGDILNVSTVEVRQ